MSAPAGGIACDACGAALAPCAWFDGVDGWWPTLAVFRHACPCGSQEYVQIAPDRIIRGYIYAAGTAHFADMDELAVPGPAPGVADSCAVIACAGRTWTVPERS